MSFTFIEPENYLKIVDIYAYISVDERGNEGICAAPIQGKLIPLVTADEKRLATFKPYAELINSKTNQQIKLVKFSTREDVEVIG